MVFDQKIHFFRHFWVAPKGLNNFWEKNTPKKFFWHAYWKSPPSPSQLINSIDHVRPYWYTNYKQNNYYTTISKCKWQQHMGSALNIVLFQMNQLRFKMVVSGSLNANIIMFAWEILCENTSPSGRPIRHLIAVKEIWNKNEGLPTFIILVLILTDFGRYKRKIKE